jgi:predicted acetyltransferase
LVATVDGEICGRASIRFTLNDKLLADGGHIGYCVLPPFRRRGIATEILRQSLIVGRAHGIRRVLMTCDDDNIGSASVIERCGGVLDPSWPLTTTDGTPKRRYWIA